jgi:hypothetical protein
VTDVLYSLSVLSPVLLSLMSVAVALALVDMVVAWIRDLAKTANKEA